MCRENEIVHVSLSENSRPRLWKQHRYPLKNTAGNGLEWFSLALEVPDTDQLLI